MIVVVVVGCVEEEEEEEEEGCLVKDASVLVTAIPLPSFWTPDIIYLIVICYFHSNYFVSKFLQLNAPGCKERSAER